MRLLLSTPISKHRTTTVPEDNLNDTKPIPEVAMNDIPDCCPDKSDVMETAFLLFNALVRKVNDPRSEQIQAKPSREMNHE